MSDQAGEDRVRTSPSSYTRVESWVGQATLRGNAPGN